jgi:two-component system, NtrC family, sensor kinase
MAWSPLRTISGRIVLGFTVLLVTFGGITTYTIVNMRLLGRDLRFVRGAYLEVSLNAAQLYVLQDGVVDQLHNDRDRMIRPDLALVTSPLDYNRTLRRRFLDQSLNTLHNLQSQPEQRRARIADIEQKIEGLIADHKQLDELYAALAKAPADARRVPLDAIINKEEKLKRDTKIWFNDLKSRTIRITGRLEAAEEQARLGATFLGGLAALVGLLTSAWAVMTLRPLRRLVDGVRKVARGEYKERVKVQGESEVADLAREFNAMAAALAQREQELIRSERLAAVGKMAAVITHEVRNPLSSIGLNTELLEETVRALPPDKAGEAVALCQAISKEVDRLTAITEEYLRFARMPRPKLEREQVNAIVSGLMEFQKEELGQRGIELSARLAAGLPLVAADEGQLRQAFLNLIRNAADAMTGGGTLSVATAAVEGNVEVRVADTGPGISAEVLPRIFEPFFSTKEGGTGLGLALTHQIIAEHGGRIDVESAEGKGTAFVVRLPAASPAV